MGIRFLNTFMFEHCPNGIQEINMKREVEWYKRRFKVEKPVIVVDLIAIHQFIYTNEKEKLFGGRFELYNIRMDEIFQKLCSLGVELVCVQDGSLFEDKICTLIERRNERYLSDLSTLHDVEKNLEILNSKKNLTNLITFFYNLRRIAEKYSTLIISTREGDQEIVYQANSRNTLAVISNDSDFLIFNGKWQFWCGNNLDLTKCSIIRFNKNALRTKLALSPLQMILFGTICGNDFVKNEMVNEYKRNIRGYIKFYGIADIARRISSLPPNIKKNDEDYLINIIFQYKDRKVGREDFKNSIKFYCDVNEPVKYSSSLLQQASQITFLYSVLEDVPYNISLFYFDLTKSDLMPYYQLIKPVIQRQMGTVLKNKKGNLNSLTRSIITKLDHDESYKIIKEMPVFPNDDLPPLEEFIIKEVEKNNVLYQLKLKLFCWNILPECTYFTTDTISNLQDELVITISSLAFLLEKKQILLDEADCILLSCISNFESKKHVNLDHFVSINERDARVTFLFQRIWGVVLNSVQILGLRNFEALMTFDGLYYHYLMKCNRNNDTQSMLIMKENLKNLRIYSK